jgi:hypothetical protein
LALRANGVLVLGEVENNALIVGYKKHGAATLSTTTFSIMTLRIMTKKAYM